MKAIGADLSKLNYIAHSGGGEALTSVLGGHVTVGISGYGEFGPQVDSGKLRALALSSEERLPGVDIPTLKEQGLDVAFFNWRGLFAAPEVPAEDLAALEAAVDAMVKSQAWKDTIAERGGPTFKPAATSPRSSPRTAGDGGHPLLGLAK